MEMILRVGWSLQPTQNGFYGFWLMILRGVLSKTVVTIANSDPYKTILEGNKKKVEKF